MHDPYVVEIVSYTGALLTPQHCASYNQVSLKGEARNLCTSSLYGADWARENA